MTTPHPYVRQVASNVRAELSRAGLLQKQLAFRVGQSDEWISRRLRSSNPAPMSTDDIGRIAAALQIDPDRLTATGENAPAVQP